MGPPSNAHRSKFSMLRVLAMLVGFFVIVSVCGVLDALFVVRSFGELFETVMPAKVAA